MHTKSFVSIYEFQICKCLCVLSLVQDNIKFVTFMTMLDTPNVLDKDDIDL